MLPGASSPQIGSVFIQGKRFNRDRLILWVPAVLAGGIGLFFSQPIRAEILMIGLLCLIMASMDRKGAGVRIIPKGWVALFLLVLLSGYLLAMGRTYQLSAPVLTKRIHATMVEGRVLLLEQRVGNNRLTLTDLIVDGLPSHQTPVKIRLTTRQATDFLPGDRIRLRAGLYPPPNPSVPNVYDFQRRAWFQQLGGLGYALGKVELLPEKEISTHWMDAFFAFIERKRQLLTAAIRDQMHYPETKAIAPALITGDRSAISQEFRNTMRDAGLAHLLAISGLHMGLLVMLLFSGCRTFMALMEPVALQYPIKKWAACFALLGSFAYLLVAGAPLPTQRAFLMTSVVLLAVLIDRNAISMRMVAFAATVILLLQPEAFLGASFQLSFAAVIALVAFYESEFAQGFLLQWRKNWPRRIFGYFLVLSMTTLIATIATTPFAQFHFGTVAVYGLLGNLVGVPLMGMMIMPGAVLALLLMPIGGEALGFWLMETGIFWTYSFASWISALPGAQFFSPPMDIISVVLISLGGLWICLWRGPFRWRGIVLLALGLLSIPLVRPPDILLSSNGRLLGINGKEGILYLNNLRREKFVAEQWGRLLGVSDYRLFRQTSSKSGVACDRLGCLMNSDETGPIALVLKPAALAEDCEPSELLIAPFHFLESRDCKGPKTLIDRGTLKDHGGHAIYLNGRYPWQQGVKIITTSQARGNYPWSDKGDVND
ncbi:ComEC/Rec2 family competence protein [Aestuariispira insulae]